MSMLDDDGRKIKGKKDVSQYLQRVPLWKTSEEGRERERKAAYDKAVNQYQTKSIDRR